MLSRKLRDRRAVARYAGLTGSPDESGKRRREKGLARAGNARVRRGMVQLAWRFLLFQKDSDLARWFQARTTDGRKTTRKTMIVALARICCLRCGVSSPRARCLRASSCVRRDGGTWEEVEQRHTPIGRPAAALPMTIRGGSNPKLHMVCRTADVEWAPPPRRFATDAHAASWSDPLRSTAYKSAARPSRLLMANSASESIVGTSQGSLPIEQACRRAGDRQGQVAARSGLRPSLATRGASF
ncbi:transposase [Mesorhizobium sp. M0012]|uniref:transposase n=1 Tax=Mesorhizobium sp. M0012 TaxID=2956840 RepID=UPI0033361F2C